MIKVVLPLLLLVLADGQIAGSPLEPPPLAADRAHEGAAPAKGEVKGEAKGEAKGEVKGEAKAGESKGEGKAEGKPEAKAADAKAEVKADGKAEGKAAEPKAEAHAPAAAEKVAEKAPEAKGHEAVGAVKPAAKAAASNKMATREAHAGKKPGKDANAGRGGESDRTPTPAPGISSGAMNEEMFNRAREQKAASERERLEALSSDLARARSELRDETTRLEAMVEKAKTSGKSNEAKAGAAAAGAGAGKEAPRGDGGPMPLGDPLAPNAYYRPVPPPPNFAVQVEVVSKAMKSMKPEQAAGIIGHLERGLAAEVLQRMRPADAGAILGFLKPEVGAALAAEIVSRPPVKTGKDKDGDKEKP